MFVRIDPTRHHFFDTQNRERAESKEHHPSSSAMATTTQSQSPFFRLPRELRDAIYDLAALDADSLYYEFSLKSGAPVQKKVLITSDVDVGSPQLAGELSTETRHFRMWQTTPKDTTSENGLDRVCKQSSAEYTASLERRIESLLGFGHGEPRLADFPWLGQKWVRIESTCADGSNADDSTGDSITTESLHALTIPVPVVSKPTRLSKLHAVAYFTFRFDSEDLGPREHRFVSLEPLESGFCRFTLPEPVLQQLNDLFKAADWKSSKNRAKERMLWFQYFKRQTNAIKG